MALWQTTPILAQYIVSQAKFAEVFESMNMGSKSENHTTLILATWHWA